MKRTIFSLLLIAMSVAPLTAQELTPPVIDIAARHAAFEPNHITLRRGEAVTLRFSAEERGQRVVQRDLGINLALEPERASEVTVMPPKRGRFTAIRTGRDDVSLIIDVVE